MKIGVIIETNEPEKAWNGVRFAITARRMGNDVKLFLMSAGVEVNQIDHPVYDAAAKLQEYVDDGGELLACGTCMESRGKEEGATCPASNMISCVELVIWSDRMVTF